MKEGWKAEIYWQGEWRELGEFKTAEGAYKAYKDKAKELFGEYARLII